MNLKRHKCDAKKMYIVGKKLRHYNLINVVEQQSRVTVQVIVSRELTLLVFKLLELGLNSCVEDRHHHGLHDPWQVMGMGHGGYGFGLL